MANPVRRDRAEDRHWGAPLAHGSNFTTSSPEPARSSPLVRDLAGYGCLTQMHIVRLLAPNLMNEDRTKDVDFSPSGIAKRWEAGYANTRRAIEAAPWEGEFDPLDGVILHEMNHEARLDQARGAKASPARLAMPPKVAAE